MHGAQISMSYTLMYTKMHIKVDRIALTREMYYNGQGKDVFRYKKEIYFSNKGIIVDTRLRVNCVIFWNIELTIISSQSVV